MVSLVTGVKCSFRDVTKKCLASVSSEQGMNYTHLALKIFVIFLEQREALHMEGEREHILET